MGAEHGGGFNSDERISFSHAGLWGATETVAVTQVDVAEWAMKGLRRANWETLAWLEGETKSCLSKGAGMLTFY